METASVLGSLPPMWESQRGFLTPSFSLAFTLDIEKEDFSFSAFVLFKHMLRNFTVSHFLEWTISKQAEPGTWSVSARDRVDREETTVQTLKEMPGEPESDKSVSIGCDLTLNPILLWTSWFHRATHPLC